jgi:hypothetical protein
MPLRKPTDIDDPTENALEAIQEALALRDDPSAEVYSYEAELDIEVIKRIQQKADETLKKEEWVVIDGVDKP